MAIASFDLNQTKQKTTKNRSIWNEFKTTTIGIQRFANLHSNILGKRKNGQSKTQQNIVASKEKWKGNKLKI